MDKEKGTEMAMFRFGLIAPVINQTFSEPTKTAYYEAVCSEALLLPCGAKVSYSPSTLSYWEHLYQRGGFDALVHKSRADKGYQRKLTEDAKNAIVTLKKTYPKINATMIFERLIEEGIIAADEVSLSTVQRFIRARVGNLHKASGTKDRKAFEAECVGELWQADTLHGPYAGKGKDKKRAYLIAIIDDKSRLITGARFVAADNALNFQKVLKDAILRFGVPKKCFVDNGGPYKNDQLSAICGALGCVLIHTSPRDPESKGKIERFNRTCRGRFLSVLEDKDTQSLEALNDALVRWINTYNTSEHSALKKSPMAVFTEGIDDVREAKSVEWLHECFLNRLTRTVKADATIAINNVSYDVPMNFIGLKVLVRFSPEEMDTAFIEDEGLSYPIYPTDKVANSKTRRGHPKDTYKLDFSKDGGASDVS